jgi:hypothetical protein
MSLFGCAPKRPLDYSGSAGLLWALNGGRLVQLHRDWAAIDVPVNRSERVFYRRNVDVAKLGFLGHFACIPVYSTAACDGRHKFGEYGFDFEPCWVPLTSGA